MTDSGWERQFAQDFPRTVQTLSNAIDAAQAAAASITQLVERLQQARATLQALEEYRRTRSHPLLLEILLAETPGMMGLSHPGCGSIARLVEVSRRKPRASRSSTGSR
jgi:hypothetical protein